MNEERRPIKGYEYRYSVSNLGIVYSKDKVLKPNLTNHGYMRVGFYGRGLTKYKGYSVHRLVAIEFIPNPKKYPFVNHINGIKTDNRVENLEWCTPKQNMSHAWAIGLMSEPRRKASVIPEDHVLIVYTLSKSGWTLKEIAEVYNVDKTTVSKLVNGVTWKRLKVKEAYEERIKNREL